MTAENEAPEPHAGDDGRTSREERLVEALLVVVVPFLIGFTAWGIVILAFSEWKLY